MSIRITKEQLLELVKEALKEYEVFFDDLPVDENITLDLLVSSVYESVHGLDKDEQIESLLITACVLVYENFKLNYKPTK